MNHNALTCPSQSQLMAFVAGKLNVTESAEIEQHLADCESCCQLLKMLPDSDTLVSLLRDPQAETADDNGRSPSIAPALPPVAEQLTLPPGGATEIADATAKDGALSLPESLRDHSRYRVTQLLGRGGMGDVYKAHHRMMNRPVALKVMNAQLVSSHAAVLRFHREVQAAARLTHPNIVTAFDAEQAGDTHFLVMEYVDGVELSDVIKDRGPLPVAEACDYVRQAAVGLQHAHEQGMVHRDIKPQNLMLVSRESRAESPEPERAKSQESRVESQNDELGGHLSGSGLSTLDSRHSAPGPSTLDSRPSIKILDFGLANLAGAAAEEVIQDESGSRRGGLLDRQLT
ncbi:MAG: protein kinase, partial [Planctomycetia bacterium]|nr:protein kinase [Planctomycetia bacterium]